MKKLFFWGLILHILYNLIILSTNNIISPAWNSKDENKTNLLSRYLIDTKSYIDAADNYIKYGVFGKKNNPDYHRTIGYPYIIYLFKSFFGNYWYISLTIFQTLIGALIYPLSFLIGRIFYPKNEKAIFWAVVMMMLLGGYFTKSLYVLTDMPLSVFFLAGIYFNLLAVIKKKNIFYIIIGFFLISIAALIRPVLILYPIAHFLILIYISKQYKTWHFRIIRKVVILSSLLLMVTINFSSFKMYYYYKTLTPTDILGINMFNYTVRNILTNEGELQKYFKLEEKINNEKDWLIKDIERKKIFYKTIKKHPLTAILFWIERGAAVHLFYPHYMQIGEIFGYYNKSVTGRNKKMQKTVFMQTVLYVFAGINIIIFLFFIFYLVKQLIFYKRFLFTIAIICIVFLVLGPSFLAPTAPRMRLPIEPFIFIFAFQYISSKFIHS
jgi:4-amino-4-deoxy-L-arabinose transferase-like glycosyltransferase